MLPPFMLGRFLSPLPPAPRKITQVLLPTDPEARKLVLDYLGLPPTDAEAVYTTQDVPKTQD